MARMLVIDDDVLVRNLLRAAFQRMGHEVRDAADGAAGLRAFQEERPDIIVTDVYMPTMDGIEMIQALRLLDPVVPILAISGGGITGPGGPLTDARLLGASATLAKPFTIMELQSAVAALL